MKLHHLFALAALATASTAGFADTITAPLDISQGNGSFGRNNAVGDFTDTYTFTLLGSSFFAAATASTAASGEQDLDYTSLLIWNAADVIVGTFQGNLGTDLNEFYSLPQIVLQPGAYRLVVKGVNSPTQASYTGNISISPFVGNVPEPGTTGLVLAGLGLAFVLKRRKA